MKEVTADVAVIGAGLAGLVCAYNLAKKGQNVLMLEAHNRVGGRCVNQPLSASYPGLSIESGGQLIAPKKMHPRIWALADELDVERFDTSPSGMAVDYRNGRRRRYWETVLPPCAISEKVELIRRMVCLNRLAKSVPIKAPWDASRARDWDSMTLQEWIDRNVGSDRVKSLMRLAVLAIYSVEPREMSLLFFLQSAHSAGSVFKLINDAQALRFVGGPQAIVDRLAAELDNRIRLDSPVDWVEKTPDAIRIYAEGFSVSAKVVVVAVPPPVVAKIRFVSFDDAIRQRQQLMGMIPMGSIWKCQAVYKTPFWRKRWLNGRAVSVDVDLRAKIVFDNSPKDGTPGILCAFVFGDDVKKFASLTAAGRKAAILNDLAAYFGPDAKNAEDYVEMDWQAQPYIQGGPAGVFPPGVLTTFKDVLCKSIGNVFWAGTETTLHWCGYMEGAVQSGERAADEVIKAV